jgi:hypothetical protein
MDEFSSQGGEDEEEEDEEALEAHISGSACVLQQQVRSAGAAGTKQVKISLFIAP